MFFRGKSSKAGGAFRRGSTKSRKQSGAVLFRVIATGYWRDFSKRIDQKPKTVWSYTFSGHRSGPLERLFAKYRPKAGSCLELYFFGLSQRATWGASRSVWKGSRRLSGRNVFSGYISGRWRDFLQRIDQKPKAVWSYSFSGHRSRSLREPRGRCGKAAGSGRVLKLF